MRLGLSVFGVAALCLWWCGSLALAAEPAPAAEPYVVTQPASPADFSLVGEQTTAQILVDRQDHKGCYAPSQLCSRISAK